MARVRTATATSPVNLAGLLDFGARRLAQRCGRRFSSVWRVPSSYRASGLGIHLPSLVPGDPDTATAVYRGRFAFAATAIECRGQVIFDHRCPDREWMKALHGFAWLAALETGRRELYKVQARTLVGDWIDRARQFGEPANSNTVAARRLISWTQHAPFLIDGAHARFEGKFFNAVTRHVRCLHRSIMREHDPLCRLQCATALVYACLGFEGLEALRQSAYAHLAGELHNQILPDGGHVSRNPAILLDLLVDLMPLRSALQRSHLEVPPELNQALERMTPMLRFFCHDDGGLAAFNGVSNVSVGKARAVLNADSTLGRPLTHALHSGYCRLAQGQACVIADVGQPPAPGLNPGAASDPLAFEFSDGAHRIVVNCGAPSTLKSDWSEAARMTAAHSTVCLNDRSAGIILSDRLTRGIFGTPVVIGPNEVNAKVLHTEHGIVAEAAHDGYLNSFGIIHHRRLFLAGTGYDLRGEDRFLADLDDPANLVNVPFAARFHLHPVVKATLSMDAASVMLILPNRTGWRFSARGGRLKLEDSVYLPGSSGARKTKQIVVEGITGRTDRIQWAFKRIARRKPSPHQAADSSPQLPL